MISCPRCLEQITRKNPQYCYRCGFRLTENKPVLPISVPATTAPATTAVAAKESAADGFVLLASENEPTPEETALIDAQMAAWSSRRRAKRRVRRRIALKIAVLVGILGVLLVVWLGIRR